MAVTIADLVAQIRLLSNLRRNNYFTDVDISEFLDDGAKELADIFIASYEHYFQRTFEFDLEAGADGSGSNVVTLPDDFQKTNLLLRPVGGGGPEVVRMLSNLLERNGTNQALWGPGGRRYFLAAEGSVQTLEVLPASMAQGTYRLLYTPQLPSMAFPREPTFTAAVRSTENLDLVPFGTEPAKTWTVTPNPGAALVMNGVTLAADVLVLLASQDAQEENGVFRCAESDAGGTIFVRADNPLTGQPLYPAIGQTVLVTGGTLGAGYYVETAEVETVDTDPVVYAQPSLPVVLTPWQRYLKVYAALTIRRARAQPSDDLATELEMLKARTQKMAANRNEEPTQAPIERGRRGGWWGGSGGW